MCGGRGHSSMSYCKTVETMIEVATKNPAQEIAINCRSKFPFSTTLRTSIVSLDVHETILYGIRMLLLLDNTSTIVRLQSLYICVAIVNMFASADFNPFYANPRSLWHII
ncbi:hypothetical protein F2Q69_00017242 [Brassica cretica]|uniref:Uncharacterized protein n=1 Tax=Brassica cretica TaxID=69181 RepID=A0A8S9R7J8_BRACR|nr:hypothetical protein F2Q69_00017242 [Brassica cretica]